MFRWRSVRSNATDITTPRFVDGLVRSTRRRGDLTHLHLMLQEGGSIGVQWESPRGNRLGLYRIVHTGLRRLGLITQTAPSCPHCAMLAAINALDKALPLDALAAARTRDQYLLFVEAGKLPCPTFASPGGLSPWESPSTPAPGWMADCHAAAGNPHTAADCLNHKNI